jgi:hypothetical protein
MRYAGYRVRPRCLVVDIRHAAGGKNCGARALAHERCHVLVVTLGAVADTTKQNLLRMAAQRLGPAELAKRLNVPESLLTAWMSGHASMPDRKLLVLADLLDKLGDAPPS